MFIKEHREELGPFTQGTLSYWDVTYSVWSSWQIIAVHPLWKEVSSTPASSVFGVSTKMECALYPLEHTWMQLMHCFSACDPGFLHFSLNVYGCICMCRLTRRYRTSLLFFKSVFKFLIEPWLIQRKNLYYPFQMHICCCIGRSAWMYRKKLQHILSPC